MLRKKKQKGNHFKMAALNENLDINSHYLVCCLKMLKLKLTENLGTNEENFLCLGYELLWPAH